MSKVPDGTAASSPAPNTPPEQNPPSFAERSSKWTAEQWNEWNLRGKEPESPTPSKQEGEPSPEATPGKGEAPKAAPESGPDKNQQEPKPDATHRRLSRRDRKIGEQAAEIRRLQRELDTARAGRQPNAESGRQTEPTTKTLDRPKRPKVSDFETIDAYEAALDKYETDLDGYHDAKIAHRHQELERQRERQHVEREADEEFIDQQRDWHKRCGAYQKDHADFPQAFQKVSTATLNAKAVHIDKFIVESDHGPALVDHLAKHPDILEDLLELSDVRAVAQLGRIEDQLTKAPVPKKTSSAPEPPDKIGGKDEKVDGPPIGSRAWFDQENAKDVRRLLGTQA